MTCRAMPVAIVSEWDKACRKILRENTLALLDNLVAFAGKFEINAAGS
jgi:hypothetical protein